MRYSAQQLEEMFNSRLEWLERASGLETRLTTRAYENDQARKYGRYGLARRIASLTHAISRIEDLVSPELDDISVEDVRDAELMLQAFQMNVFGAIDNIAWLWVTATHLTKENGGDLSKYEIGLSVRSKAVRKSLPEGLQRRVIENDGWFAALRIYRDGIAHGIPVYIPRMISPSDYERLQNLESLKSDAVDRGDMSAVVEAWSAQAAIGRFGTMMVIDAAETSMLLHPQMICDLATVVDLTEYFLNELDGRMLARTT